MIATHQKQYTALKQFATSTSKHIEGFMHKNHLDRETRSHMKKLFQEAQAFQERIQHVLDIAEARKDISAGRTVSQEKLFRKLGL